jgi:hypothetical protein
MLVAFLGVDAEGKALEEVAIPLSVIARPAGGPFPAGGRPGPTTG